MTNPKPTPVDCWHALVGTPDADGLRALLADTVVFRSPAVHTPQEGPDRAFAYLWAALDVLGPTLRYHDQWLAADSAVLRFGAELDGLQVDGVDIIRWDEDGRITEFTVMARPFKGLQALISAMGRRLAENAR